MSSSPLPSKILKWSGATHRGKVRANNEDSFLGLQFNAEELHHLGRMGESSTGHADFVFAVSDGMGGAKAGEFASKIAVEKITRLLPPSFKQSAEGLEAGFTDILTELFDQIHRAISFVGGSYEECEGMQATLSMCWFTPNWMHFAHIGDSRIYYLPAGAQTLRQLSHDDTHVGWLFRTGQINEREARQHPRRNVLQKALGGGNQFVEPQVGSVGYETGDLFLLCTDGLVDGFFDDQLAELLHTFRSTGGAAGHLIEASLEKAARDNITAMVIEVA